MVGAAAAEIVAPVFSRKRVSSFGCCGRIEWQTGEVCVFVCEMNHDRGAHENDSQHLGIMALIVAAVIFTMAKNRSRVVGRLWRWLLFGAK